MCRKPAIESVSFRTDSQAIYLAMEKEFAKNKKYARLLAQALVLMKQLDLFFIKWIPSSENKSADQLARRAIRLNKESTNEENS